MEFLTKYLWNIFALAREENNDGDNLNPDMGGADDLFISAINGGEKYKCLDGLDLDQLSDEWATCDQGAAKREYDMLVIGPLGNKTADRFKELAAAFNEGDREAFDAAVKDGLEALYGPEGVDD